MSLLDFPGVAAEVRERGLVFGDGGALPPGFAEAVADHIDPPEVAWPLHFRLKRTVTVPGGELSELQFREPSTADYLEFGIFDGIDGQTLFKLAVRLSGKPEPVLKAIPGPEMARLVRELSRFLVDASK